MEGFLFQASIFLAAAVIAVPLAARLGLGSVLGYLAAGIVIGPIMGFVGGHETLELQHFAEFGVVMMLFLIGLELEPRALWDMRHRLLGLGGLQISLTTLFVMVGAMMFGLTVSMAFAVGLIFALSSTAIVLQTLSEKGLMQTGGGRSSFSVLLTQDIAVIPMLALLPLLAWPKSPDVVLSETLERMGQTDAVSPKTGGAHEAAATFIDSLPGWGVTLVTLAAGVAVVDACRAVGVDATLKWPNDVLVGDDDSERGGRKLSGILTEMEGEADRVSWLLVGIGLNANIAGDALPAGATSLQEQVGAVDRRAVLQTILESLSTLVADPDTVLDRWRAYSSTLGRTVRVDTGREQIEGTAVDVQFPGALVVDTDSGEQIVHAGDCEHLRPA